MIKADNSPIIEKIGELKGAISRSLCDLVKQSNFDPVLNEMIKGANEILLNKNAKRIRAIIPLLIAEEIDADIETFKRYGVLIELLHFASLVHDDVVDEAVLRRKQPTLNSQFTNANAVFIGDHFVSQSLEYALQTTNSGAIIEQCIRAVKDLVTGVVLEDLLAKRNMGFGAYEKMAVLKTGSLFGLSFGLPFIGTDQLHSGLETGRRFGLLFQIYDDHFDRHQDVGFFNIYNILPEDDIHKRCLDIYRQVQEKCELLGISNVLYQTIEYLQTSGYFLDLKLP